MSKSPTHKELVLRHLQDYGKITSFEAFTEYGITRLSATIYGLRHLGYNIVADDLVRTNRYGKKVIFAEYKLIDGGNTDE